MKKFYYLNLRDSNTAAQVEAITAYHGHLGGDFIVVTNYRFGSKFFRDSYAKSVVSNGFFKVFKNMNTLRKICNKKNLAHDVIFIIDAYNTSYEFINADDDFNFEYRKVKDSGFDYICYMSEDDNGKVIWDNFSYKSVYIDEGIWGYIPDVLNKSKIEYKKFEIYDYCLYPELRTIRHGSFDIGFVRIILDDDVKIRIDFRVLEECGEFCQLLYRFKYLDTEYDDFISVYCY